MKLQILAAGSESYSLLNPAPLTNSDLNFQANSQPSVVFNVDWRAVRYRLPVEKEKLTILWICLSILFLCFMLLLLFLLLNSLFKAKV